MPAKLQWVSVADEVVHVSQFASLKPKQRPRASCPVCGDQVIMKLGAKNAHHCAHKPDAVCAATSGETAVHLNSKLYIARKLEKEIVRAQQDGDLPRLVIKELCGYKGGYYEKTCTEERSTVWAVGFDEVAVEVRVGNRQPDITLRHNGMDMAGIEVHVTNAVSDEKAADLKLLGLPWIEVKGKPELYEGDWPWNSLQTLKVTRTGEGRWRCATCAVKEAEAAARKAEEARLEQEWADEKALREKESAEDAAVREHLRNNGWHKRAARIVDYYFSSGKKYRDLYIIEQYLVDGEITKLVLYRAGRDGNLVEIDGDASDAAKRDIAAGFRCEVDNIALKAAVVDTWHKWLDAKCYSVCNESAIYGDYYNPYRYKWNSRQRRWFKRQSY